MEAKQYLLQIRKSSRIINNKISELEVLRDISTKTTPNGNNVQFIVYGVSDKVGKTAAKIIDLQNEIEQEINRLAQLRQEVLKVLDTLEPNMMDLLYRRYFKLESWETIANEMHYTYRWVLILHGKALLELQKKLSAN